MECGCLSGNMQMIKFLLERGVNPNTQDEVHLQLVAVLLCLFIAKHVNTLIQDGWTPLMTASCRDLPDIVQELLNGGANPDIRNKVYQ